MGQWRNQNVTENTLRQIKIKHNFSQSMGWSKSSSKREIYSGTDLPQKTRKISNKQLNLRFKRIRKPEETKPKASRGKEIIKIRRGNK